MALLKLSKSERRRLSLFITCCGIALFAWLFFALSNKYVYQVDTVVSYHNLPQNKAFHPLQSDTIKLQIEGSGWQLLFARLRLDPQSVRVDLKTLNSRNYITFSNQLRAINNSFATNQKVVSVLPDTLYFDFSSRDVKRVPINVIHQIGFRNQYGVSGDIKTEPAYVTISGPKDAIAKIKYWDTDTLKAKDVNTTLSSTVAIKPSQKANITAYPKVLNVTIPVDEFTEKQVDVPLKVINNPTALDARLVPSKVRITFLTSLSNYPAVDADYFEAVVDIDKWKKDRYPQLPVLLRKLPDHAKIRRIEPQNVDFIISQ